jgi:hypothetical protein
VVAEVRGTELGRGAVLVAALGVGAAVGLVLRLAAGPVLELLGRVALLDLLHDLLGLFDLFLFVLGLARRVVVGLGLVGRFLVGFGLGRGVVVGHGGLLPEAVKRKRPRGAGRAAVSKRIPPQLFHERALGPNPYALQDGI